MNKSLPMRQNEVYPVIVGTLSPQLQGLLPDQGPTDVKVRTVSARFTFSPQKLTDSLLCSHFELLVGIKDSLDRAFKNHALVEYALAGMDNRLFVSKYQLKLPKKEEISRFLEKQMKFGINKGQS